MNGYLEKRDGIFPSVCSLDCPDQCGLLIHKKDGKIVKVEGDPDHPVTKGNICNKVRNMADRIYDSKRLAYPLKRAGAKGEKKFVRISWEEALSTIASRWKELQDSYGAESILPYSFYGNMGRVNSEGMDRRFFHYLGASQLDRTICNSAGSVGYRYTMGGSLGTDPEDTEEAKLIIFWGINAVSTNMHQIAIAQKARKKGAKVIVIDVHKNQTGRFADWFIPILPGTDAALALGIMNILFSENLENQTFLRQYTIGYEELKEHVKQYDPSSVSSITGIPVEDIYRLARMYGETSPSFIRIGNGLQHHDNGGMCIRTISCLPAITGQWLYKGGGALKGNSAFLAINSSSLERPDLLKNKATRRINMNLLGNALLEAVPPIQSLYVYNSNPAVVAPQLNKVKKGLLREDLFTIVHDLFITETAAYADIVLPATSSFEAADLYTSYWHHYAQVQQPVIKPYGESKSNSEVFRLLTEYMGFDHHALRDSDKEMIDQALDYPDNPAISSFSLEKLLKHQYMRADRKPLFPGKLPTPSGKIELFSETMLKDGYPPLPTYIPLPFEDESLYQFVPGPNQHFLNSTFSNNEKHISLEKQPRVFINSGDALKEGIANGDYVRIWNNQGECVLKAAVGAEVLQGVLVSQGLWTNQPGTRQLVNELTPDRVADMGGGATFFSGRVNIEKIVI